MDLPEESPGTVPTREWLYYYWKDNAHQGQNWCKYGRANGSYIQQIEYDDCQSGNVWTPGQSVIASIGQGYVSVTPLQLADAYAALANGGTLYSPRIGEALLSPNGKVARQITPAGRRAPAGVASPRWPTSAARWPAWSPRAPRRAPSAASRWARCAWRARPVPRRWPGNLATSVFASFAPCGHPKYVVVMMIPDSGYGADVSAPGGPPDLGLDLRAGGAQGGPARRAAARPPRINKAGQIVATRPAGQQQGTPTSPARQASGEPG